MIRAMPRKRGHLECRLTVLGDRVGRYGRPKSDKAGHVRSFCVESQFKYELVRRHVKSCSLCDPEEAVRTFHANRFHRSRPMFSSDTVTAMVEKYVKDFGGHPYDDGGPAAFTSPSSQAMVRDFYILSRPDSMLEHTAGLTREEAGRILMLHWRVMRDEAHRTARRSPDASALWTPHAYGVLRRAVGLSQSGLFLLSMFEACLNRDEEGLSVVRSTVGESEFRALTDILDEADAASVLQA